MPLGVSRADMIGKKPEPAKAIPVVREVIKEVMAPAPDIGPAVRAIESAAQQMADAAKAIVDAQARKKKMRATVVRDAKGRIAQVEIEVI